MAKSLKSLERDVRSSMRIVSLEARGLWHEMRHLVECEHGRDGRVQLNGRPIAVDRIAFLAGSTPADMGRLLGELEEVGLVAIDGPCVVLPHLASIGRQREARCGITQRWRGRGGGEWEKLRQLVLDRDGFTCAYCGAEADSVDHVEPRCRGGRHATSNLVAACLPCNAKKNGRTPEQAGMPLRFDRRPPQR